MDTLTSAQRDGARVVLIGSFGELDRQVYDPMSTSIQFTGVNPGSTYGVKVVYDPGVGSSCGGFDLSSQQQVIACPGQDSIEISSASITNTTLTLNFSRITYAGSARVTVTSGATPTLIETTFSLSDTTRTFPFPGAQELTNYTVKITHVPCGDISNSVQFKSCMNNPGNIITVGIPVTLVDSELDIPIQSMTRAIATDSNMEVYLETSPPISSSALGNISGLRAQSTASIDLGIDRDSLRTDTYTAQFKVRPLGVPGVCPVYDISLPFTFKQVNPDPNVHIMNGGGRDRDTNRDKIILDEGARYSSGSGRLVPGRGSLIFPFIVNVSDPPALGPPDDVIYFTYRTPGSDPTVIEFVTDTSRPSTGTFTGTAQWFVPGGGNPFAVTNPKLTFTAFSLMLRGFEVSRPSPVITSQTYDFDH